MALNYDNDRLDGKDAVKLCILASTVVGAIANCLSCHSLLAAKLSYRAAVDALAKLAEFLDAEKKRRT